MCSKLSPPGIYLLRWGGLGKGVVGVVCAQPGYVMAGRERGRQEPVLMPIPAPDTNEACSEPESHTALLDVQSQVQKHNSTATLRAHAI